MRIVTEFSETVTEEMPLWPQSASKSNMYSILIKITPLFKEVPTATGRPVAPRLAAVLLL